METSNNSHKLVSLKYARNNIALTFGANIAEMRLLCAMFSFFTLSRQSFPINCLYAFFTQALATFGCLYLDYKGLGNIYFPRI